jgi:hypothetical protein
MKPISLSQNGFALIASILAVLVLTAVGILVFAASTQDIRISGRLVGEKRAFSAAETGVHWLTANLNPANLPASQVDHVAVAGTSSQYSITQPVKPNTGPAFLPITGYSVEGGKQWGLERFNAGITGTNTAYNSFVQFDVGVGFGPVDCSTLYQ